ncbi:hypothetical protein BC828DRAFT_12291 [Blastocladiella britannica]|nr:hypothetical protein BC828DRAFT_12291 [Blastocladiella britannica]
MIGRGIFGVRLDDQQFGAQNAHWTVDLAISTLRFVPCLDAYLLIRVMVPRMRLLLRDVHNKAASNAREGSITSSLAPKRPKRPAESLSVLSRRGSEATLITGVQPSASATADRSGTASSLRAPSPTPSKSQVIAGHMRSTSLTPSASTPILISDPPPSALHPNRERRRESSGSWRDSDRAARGSFSATAAGEARTRSPAPSQHTSTRPSQQRTRSRSPSRSRTASQSVGRNGSMGRDGSMSMGRESAASSLNRNARLSGDEFSAFTASLDRDSSGRPYLSQGFSQGQGQSQSQPSSLGQGRYFGRQSWN